MGCYYANETDSFASIYQNDSTTFIRCRATAGQVWTYCYGYNFECDSSRNCWGICARSLVSIGNCTCEVKGGVVYQKGSCALN
jgi:hypothetical protein